MTDAATARQIAALNDAFRTTWEGGTLFLTAGIRALPPAVQAGLLQAVQTYQAFTPDNDPHREHDFGAFDWAGQRIFWKIDYYDPTLTVGSGNPADPNQTRRVLTILLADEY